MGNIKKKVVVIGGGLTGLSTAFFLKRKNIDVLLIEKNDRLGGQIHSFSEDGFIFESGPNTGVVSYPEIVEMFNELSGKCKMDVARDEAKKRLIWKGKRFHALPSGPISANDHAALSFLFCRSHEVLFQSYRYDRFPTYARSSFPTLWAGSFHE